MWRVCLVCLLMFTRADVFSVEAQHPKLFDFRENIYSQFGEDGVIRKIFEIIGSRSKVSVEFGAWDGFYLSNTANLWVNEGWKGVLIECDRSRFNDLVKNVHSYNCVPVNRAVGKDSHDCLETILREINFSDPIDLLSIDIDGNDYYIFQSLAYLRPRVIICEYNPTFPAHLDMYPDYNNYTGCSVTALMRIAKEKGYSLIAITDVNCFFVLDEEFDKFTNYTTALEKIRIDQYLRYLVTDYAGNYTIVGSTNSIDAYGTYKRLKTPLNGHFLVYPPPPKN